MKQASNDSFADHGIDHISASQINTFIMNPCRWILKVSGYTDPTGNAHMWRGTAVDNAVSGMLMDGLSKEQVMALGKNVFETKVAYAKKVDPENINDIVFRLTHFLTICTNNILGFLICQSLWNY